MVISTGLNHWISGDDLIGELKFSPNGWSIFHNANRKYQIIQIVISITNDNSKFKLHYYPNSDKFKLLNCYFPKFSQPAGTSRIVSESLIGQSPARSLDELVHIFHIATAGKKSHSYRTSPYITMFNS